ncbi:MAG: glycoside hydrolase 5 family protein [Saccharospirillum sp.]
MTDRWTPEQAWDWYQQHPWPLGCNFIPSTACNQLEFWQAESFDAETIEQELALAQATGFNLLRVYLHDLVWQQDSASFIERIERFLALAAKHRITVLFVFFDDCWCNYAFPGPQPEPRPGVHNSQWLQSPGARHVINPASWPRLKEYVQGVLAYFRDDRRIFGWDLYNEPGNEGMLGNSLGLLEAVYQWAREVNPSQPLTTAPFRWTEGFTAINAFHLANADILSFHDYEGLAVTDAVVKRLEPQGRPMLCTEYMARSQGSELSTHLPYFKEKGIGALNWGFVAGRTQTNYPWESQPSNDEPALWFHDLYYPDQTPYRPDEIALIQSLSAK